MRVCEIITKKHIYTRYLTFKSINSFIVKINLITLAFYTLNTRKHSVHIKVILVKSHFICYIFKSVCSPILQLSYAAWSPNTHPNLNLIDHFIVESTITSLPVMKNAVYILYFWMIKFLVKPFQRHSEERSITEDIKYTGYKTLPLTWPFSLGI